MRSFDIKESYANEKVAIVDLLERSPRALSNQEIRTSLQHRRKLPLYQISQLLRSLSNEGNAIFSNGRWSFRSGQPKSNNNNTSPYVAGIQIPVLSPLGLEALGRPAKEIFTGSTDPKDSSTNQPPNKIQDILNGGGPWSKFRKLIAYYKECIRNEEGAEASAFINDYGRRFLYFSKLGEWYPKAGRSWIHTIPLGNHLADFVKELGAAGDSAVVVLGYPLQGVYVSKENEPDVALIRPVFQYLLKVQYSNGGLTLTSTNSRPEICLDWLKYAFKSNNQQRNFLSACGLINNQRDTGEVAEYDPGHGMPDLGTLTTTLSAFLAKKIKQPLLIDETSSEPLKQPFETGIYNKAVIMLGSKTKFTKTLLNELSAIENADDSILDSTALQYLFRDNSDRPSVPDVIEKRHESCVVDTDLMNGEQRQAVAALMSHNISVVTGPPGTGKSQVVCSGIANARLTNSTTIFASRNHKAIDAVANRLRDKGDRPLIVRANSKEDPTLRYTFATAIRDILTENCNVASADNLKKTIKNIELLLESRGEDADLACEIQDLRTEIGELEGQLTDCSLKIPFKALQGLDSQPEVYPAVSIRKLNNILSNIVLANDIYSTFTNTLQRAHILLRLPEWLHAASKVKRFDGLTNLSIFNLITKPELVRACMSQLLQAANYADVKQRVIPLILKQKDYRPFEDLISSIEVSSERIATLAPKALSLDLDSRNGLPYGTDLREKLASLKVALKAKASGLVDDSEVKRINEVLRENIPILLNHFPSWAVTNLSIGSRLPLVPGMFDLAVIDEASQSDIPSAIPILYRAKRAAVVGDPNQLTHTSKLSVAKDTLLRKRVGLSKFEDLKYSYTDTSLYDLFAQSSEIKPIFLGITYRSVDSIAEYSNATFYGGKLRVATDVSKLRIPSGSKAGIHWTDIDGDVKSAGGGGCFCAEEVTAVIDVIRTILEDNNFQGTLGVVTPFRQQANRIQDALYQNGFHFNDLEKVQLHVDTSHGFQGDEKDVMIFSLCAGPNMPAGSRIFLRETSNLFNVAVSRARAVLHVLGNRAWADRCGIPHIQNLAKPARRSETQHDRSQWHPHESPWEEILYKALVAKGVDPIPQYPVSGRRLDMALVGNNEPHKKIDIEVDGDRYHRNRDGTRKKDDIWRDIQLQGMGWIVMRFWVYQLREDIDGCVDKIVTAWSKND